MIQTASVPSEHSLLRIDMRIEHYEIRERCREGHGGIYRGGAWPHREIQGRLCRGGAIHGRERAARAQAGGGSCLGEQANEWIIKDRTRQESKR